MHCLQISIEDTYRGCLVWGHFSYDMRFEAIFFRNIAFLKRKINQKTFSSPHGNLTFPWEGNICHDEKTKIPLSPPKATHLWPLSVATSIKGIFGNLPNIFGNLICTPNTPKISYLIKLFLKIVFPRMKVHSVHQMPHGKGKNKTKQKKVS